MKNTHKILMAALSFIIVLAACTKEPLLPKYNSGIVPTLSINDAEIGPVTEDSNLYRLKMSWTNPELATDISNTKFITQIDLAGRNFANPLMHTSFGVFKDSFQNKEINRFLLDNGIAIGNYADLEVRLLASYANNNDMKISNLIPMRFRAYRIPPRVQLPPEGRLFIVGSATQGGWSNPPGVGVPLPTQEFNRLSSTSWGGVFQFTGGGEYLALPTNASWLHKYAVANNSLPGLENGGDFGYDFSSNFPGPSADGWYKLTFDFQVGKFMVENVTSTPVPDSLYGIGDATLAGWDNGNGNLQLKKQSLKKLNSSIFEGNLSLEAGKNLKFIAKVGPWQPQFGKGSADGKLGYNYGGGSDPNTISVSATGVYKVRVDFYNMTYTLTKQ